MTRANFRALDHLSGGVAAHPEEADTLRDRLQQLESQVAAVRALHKYEGGGMCYECQDYWPCPTIAALDGVQAQGEEQ